MALALVAPGRRRPSPFSRPYRARRNASLLALLLFTLARVSAASSTAALAVHVATRYGEAAAWDAAAQSWSFLGGGRTPEQYALATTPHDDALYLGNEGTVLRLTDGIWTSVGASAPVHAVALEVHAGELCAAAATRSHLECWNGTAWRGVGGGANDDILALLSTGADLYVGGRFTAVGPDAVPAAAVAVWRADGTWAALGTGLKASVYALAAFEGAIFAAGSFTLPGGLNHVARWDPATGTWGALAGGTVDDDVYALAAMPGYLYVGGFFGRAGDIVAPRLARWNGSAWSCVGTNGGVGGDSPGVMALTTYPDQSALVVGGRFTVVDGVATPGVAVWADPAWTTFGLDARLGPVFAVHVACFPGFVGSPACQACAPLHFGDACTPCSHCRGVCTAGRSNGSCSPPCVPGWTGPTCTECEPGRFSPDCLLCNTTCAPPNGAVCYEGAAGNCTCAAGWTGALCNTCADGYYGPDCVDCNLCAASGGVCYDGDAGYCGSYCSSDAVRLGDSCYIPSIAVGVLLLVGGILVAVIFCACQLWRRARRTAPYTRIGDTPAPGNIQEAAVEQDEDDEEVEVVLGPEMPEQPAKRASQRFG